MLTSNLGQSYSITQLTNKDLPKPKHFLHTMLIVVRKSAESAPRYNETA